MKVVFIGAGNVATCLAKELYKYSFDIIQICSRTMQSATILAQQVGATPVANISAITDDADLYIFSVKDSILESIIAQLPKNKGLWVHTSGSVPMDIFSKYTSRYGVFYPFQTFSKNIVPNWHNIPIFIEASNKNCLSILKTVAEQLSEKVSELSSEDRKYLHLAGVFACNFTNHMYVLSERILKRVNLPFETILPLIDETAAKIHTLSPAEAQTGPSIRYDENIINKHLEMIEDQRVELIYKLISENIFKMK